jgi:flagellar biogenesis protein FliO
MQGIRLAQAGSPANEFSSINSEALTYLKLIVTLAIILVVIVVVLRFWLPRVTAFRNISSGPIRMAAHFPLEPRKNLYIIQTGGEYFLVGTSESGVHYLTTLDPEHISATLSQKEDHSTDSQFGNFMKAFTRRGRAS